MNIHTGKGMFTSTNPQLRRVSPENKGDRVCVKVVYVVLEAQYQSALSNAVKNINAKSDKVRSWRQLEPSQLRSSYQCDCACESVLQHCDTACIAAQRSSFSALNLSLTTTHENLPPQVCFEIVGYLLEELRDANNLESFRKDVEASNIFIGSLIFIEELAEKVGWLPTACRFVSLQGTYCRAIVAEG